MDGGVASEFLDCGDISASGEEVTDKGSSKVVRAASLDACFVCSAFEDIEDGLSGEFSF